MSQDSVAADVARALRLDGFTPKVRAGGIAFQGRIRVRKFDFAVRLEYDGLEFDRPPVVYVDNVEILDDRVLPHLDGSGEFCAVDRRRYVADRYHAPQQARGIVRRVAEALEEGLVSNGEAEIAAEFTRYWGGPIIYVTFGPFDGFAGPTTRERERWAFKPKQRVEWTDTDNAVVVTCANPLTFRAQDRRPKTLAMTLEWLRGQDPPLVARLLDGLAALGPHDPRAILYAPNGIVAFKLQVSSRGAAQVKAIRTAGAWDRLLRGTFGSSLPVVRERGIRIDMEYVLGTNGEKGSAALGGKRVILVGCGAIGGFLAPALAQLGAGLDGGNLTLVDSETLSDRNIARHRCGADKVGLGKATACKREIELAFPGLSISALDRDAATISGRIMGADLVIDATGEQGVGEMLNAWRLERSHSGGAAPALLHVWIEGNGAAVQTHFSSDGAFGCYRCLQPDHEQPPRYPVLRADTRPAMATGCGELSFTPYGPAAPMAAAALAAHHASDWARGAPRELLRTIRLNYAETQERKPTNPTKSPLCPACATHA